jgi:endonuclease/exonuclease/phosphatase family metal-dependent hydrolase
MRSLSFRALLLVLASSWLWCCGGGPVQLDGGVDDASVDDASVDAGRSDAGLADAGLADAGLADAGLADAGLSDAGLSDAGPLDGGPLDAGGSDGGADAGGAFDAGYCPPAVGVAPPFHLRAMSANLSSGNAQSYDPGHGQRIMQALGADVVMVQEFNFGANSASDLQGFVTATFDGGYTYARGSGTIPNGVISRYPIIATGEWADANANGTRNFTWAQVDLPGPRDLWVVSLHLLTSGAGKRDAEATAIVAQLTANVPAGDFILLGGDFNTDARSEACVATLGARLVVGGDQPADQAGNGGTNTGRTKPYDWVLASPCLAANQAPVVVGSNQFDAGLVVDTRVYAPITDLAPAQVGDSAATNMQHMGVVKDFVIQP